jgi:hypothetical protein
MRIMHSQFRAKYYWCIICSGYLICSLYCASDWRPSYCKYKHKVCLNMQTISDLKKIKVLLLCVSQWYHVTITFVVLNKRCGLSFRCSKKSVNKMRYHFVKNYIILGLFYYICNFSMNLACVYCNETKSSLESRTFWATWNLVEEHSIL